MNIKNLFRKQPELKIELVKEGDEEYEELCKEHDLYIVYEKPSYLIMRINDFNDTQIRNMISSLYNFARNNSDSICMINECVNCMDKDNIDFRILKTHYNAYKTNVLIKDIEYIGIDYYPNFNYLLIKCTPTKEIYNKNIKD
jgi:hypothetical protein